MIFSLLDYPVGVIPNITRVLPEDRVIDTVGYVHGREYPQEFEDDEFGIPHYRMHNQSIRHYNKQAERYHSIFWGFWGSKSTMVSLRKEFWEQEWGFKLLERGLKKKGFWEL